MPKRKKRLIATKTSKRQRSKVSKPQIGFSTLRQMIRSVRWTESYVSLLMGIIVVIIGVLFVVSVMRQTHHIQETSSTSTVAMVSESPTVTISPSNGFLPSELKQSGKTYTVQAGDDLWHIAEKEYKSGYNWVDIAKANNLSDPSMIFSGNQLIIPSVTPGIATIAITPTPEVSSHSTSEVENDGTIKGDTYTVQSGDDLWYIAVRAYADGYQWVKIAQANNLSSPDLIFSGNILKIPR